MKNGSGQGMEQKKQVVGNAENVWGEGRKASLNPWILALLGPSPTNTWPAHVPCRVSHASLPIVTELGTLEPHRSTFQTLDFHRPPCSDVWLSRTMPLRLQILQ